jgi:polyhydroxyalkanoate synthase
MPAKMHSFYLRAMYMENKLKDAGGIEVMGTPIDLSKIKVPCYFVSTMEDHIAPWKSTYMGARLLGGPVRFVLGGSGHIAGSVNPPAANKYGYWTNPGVKLPEASEEWFDGCAQNTGSWWTDWQQWVTSFDADQVPARDPVKGKLGVLEDAPGSYAKLRLDVKKA